MPGPGRKYGPRVSESASDGPGSGRIPVLYISYDGAVEPLGQSQVVAYLERLADVADITLISFEKPGVAREAMARRLGRAGIRWITLRYHPRVGGTVRDVLAGVRAVRRERRRRPPAVVHVRSYVAALIALCAGRAGGWRLLLDIRGFWPEERVDVGAWRRGGLLDRLVRRCERWFYAESDAVVTLTTASVPVVRRRLNGREVSVEVIPTCAEVERFAGTAPRPEGGRAIWCGTPGGWYRLDLGAQVADALGFPLTVLTPYVPEARGLLGDRAADVRPVAPEHVPGELRPGDVGLCLLWPSFAKIASAPTRLAEYLAAGMPVAVTPGVGDLDALVEETGVGVLVHDETEAGLAAAARRLRELAEDPRMHERCREVARDRFGLDRGAGSYAVLYRRLADRDLPA